MRLLPAPSPLSVLALTGALVPALSPAFVGVAAAQAPAAPGPLEPIPVLIVSGANNHDWEWTSPALERILEASGRFVADITYDPATDLADAGKLAAYRALVLDYNGPSWGDAANATFLAAVRGGLGVTVVHAADNAFPGWEDYERMVCHCWRQGTGHGRFHPFDVQVEDRSHPITRTLPDLVQHPDELYHRLVHMHECDYEQLASAFSDPETGGTGQREPMIVVRHEGAGRVFHTPLGHVWKGGDKHSYEDPQFHALLLRGTEWAATGDVLDGSAGANRLSESDRRAGWRLLFDGSSLEGWSAVGGGEPGAGWQVVNGCIRRAGPGGDLLTREVFGDFELEFDFLLAAGSNSGVKVRVDLGQGGPIGPEFQLLDDPRHPAESDEHLTGALYDVVAPTGKVQHGVGRWNRARVVAREGVLEHWLNGQLLLRAELDSDVFRAAQEASKFRDRAGFARGRGPILLQDHGGEVWFRNLRLRDWDALAGREVELLTPADGSGGEPLAGWTATGNAAWTREGDTIRGAVDGHAQSFLRTDRTFGDFLFEVDVHVDTPGNSGIQFRSQLDGTRVHGYQAEIDPSDRSWSGGIYYEGGQWLDDLSEDPLARAAFDLEDWNTYRIQCVGDHLQVWVNGVQTANLHHDQHPEGFLAFQVHSGLQGAFRWRAPRLWDLSE